MMIMIVIFFSSYSSGEFRLIDGIIKSYSWLRDQKCIFGNKANPIEMNGMVFSSSAGQQQQQPAR